MNGLAEGSRGSAGTTWRRLGSKLVVVELATAIVLLVGAGLLGKSLYRLLHVDIGLPARSAGDVQRRGAQATYATNEQMVAFARQIRGAASRRCPASESVGNLQHGRR